MEKTDLELKLLWENEEIEKKKKDKEALNYFTAAVADVVKNKKMIANLAKINNMQIFKKLPAQKVEEIKSAGEYAVALIEHGYQFIEKKKEFFKLDPEDEDQKDIRESLTQLDMEDSEYGTLCMCAAGEKMQELCNRMMGRAGFDFADTKEQEIKLKRTKAVRKALELYRRGDRKAIAKMLKEGLKHACKHFVNTKKDEEAMELSGITSDILYICEHDPKLAKEGEITEEQLNIAKEVALLGKDIKTGLLAVNALISAEVDPKVSITNNERQGLMDMAFKMKTAIANKQALAKKWDAPEIKNESPELAAPQLKLS